MFLFKGPCRSIASLPKVFELLLVHREPNLDADAAAAEGRVEGITDLVFGIAVSGFSRSLDDAFTGAGVVAGQSGHKTSPASISRYLMASGL